jgi:hypothetical protein
MDGIRSWRHTKELHIPLLLVQATAWQRNFIATAAVSITESAIAPSANRLRVAVRQLKRPLLDEGMMRCFEGKKFHSSSPYSGHATEADAR